MDRKLYVTLFVLFTTCLFLYLVYVILSPFLNALGWAGVIWTVTIPLHVRLLHRCKGREITAAALMTTAVVLTLIIPIMILGISLTQEAAAAYSYLESAAQGSRLLEFQDLLSHPMVGPWLKRIMPMIQPVSQEMDTMLLDAVKRGVSSLLNYSTGILKNFFGFFINMVLMVITLFFLYKDGRRMQEGFWRVVAISENNRQIIIATVKRVVSAVMYGIFLTCLVQGALGGLGFWVAGLPSPFLFGALMAICALVPLVGTALVWLPGAGYLLLHGDILKGVLLIAWGVLAVGSIDNFIRPLFISGKAQLPILAIALGALGGLLAFGLLGVMIGPIILALIIVFFDLYQSEGPLNKGQESN
ncbi:MAG: AI-2E family transporter [Geobacter sp.]|nr:AI-2E family transporter [Geobacter sp.]